VNKHSRRLLIGIGILAATLFIVAAGIALFLDVDRYKPSIEAAATEALGMEFKIRGKASLQLLPRPRLTLPDVHLSNGKAEILSAEQVQASPRWIPLLLHRKVSIDRVFLQNPKIRIEKSSQGQMSHEAPIKQDTARAALTTQPGTISLVSIGHGDVTYLDRGSGRTLELGNLDLELTDPSWVPQRESFWASSSRFLCTEPCMRQLSGLAGSGALT